MECMKRQRSPSPPREPEQGLLAIDMGNPYFVLESECGMFVGHTKGDLMRCDVVKVRDFIFDFPGGVETKDLKKK